MTRGWLPQRAGLPSLNGGGTAAVVPACCHLKKLKYFAGMLYLTLVVLKDKFTVYRCLHGTAPAYLSADLLRVSDVGSRQRLCSATTSALVGRRMQRSTIGDRAFAAAAPAVWNSLPKDVRASTSLQLFQHRLKSEVPPRAPFDHI